MEVVETGGRMIQRIWAPVDDVDIYRVGMLTGWEAGAYDGIVNAGAAGAGPDATTKICGIIEGFDTLEDTYVAAQQGNSATGVVTAAAQLARSLKPTSNKGPWVQGDKSVHALIALIDPWTRVKVPLYNAAVGTAPTVLTVTTASSDGGVTAPTMGACDFTPVANQSTLYCRTGANAGIMRVTDDTSTTQPTVDQAFTHAAIAVGDTFVRVPCRSFGESFMGTDAEALYFDVSSTSASNYWIFNVIELHLENAGEEHVIGYFDYQHFD